MRLIDADAAIDFIGSMNMCDEISNEAYKKLTSYLDELSSAQPERKTRQWIKHENADIVNSYYVPMYECPDCHTWKHDNSDYCPDCGADMRGDKHGN